MYNSNNNIKDFYLKFITCYKYISNVTINVDVYKFSSDKLALQILCIIFKESLEELIINLSIYRLILISCTMNDHLLILILLLLFKLIVYYL